MLLQHTLISTCLVYAKEPLFSTSSMAKRLSETSSVRCLRIDISCLLSGVARMLCMIGKENLPDAHTHTHTQARARKHDTHTHKNATITPKRKGVSNNWFKSNKDIAFCARIWRGGCVRSDHLNKVHAGACVRACVRVRVSTRLRSSLPQRTCSLRTLQISS